MLKFDAVVVDLSYVKSMEELRLAEHLTKKAIERKKNIAKKKKYEFLLWLTGRTDLKSAFRQANAKGNKMILIVFSGDRRKILRKLDANEIETSLKEKAKSLDLERISLSRIKN